MAKVAIIGIGIEGLSRSSPELSYKEMIFRAAQKAYDDAGVDPQNDIESCVAASEDLLEGTSIFDSYVPDQLGLPLKPVCTVAADGFHALATAYMQISSRLFDLVAVEAHSKISEVVNPAAVLDMALDPIYYRPFRAHPYFVAALEMMAYSHRAKATREHFSLVVQKNRKNALRNPRAAYGSLLEAEAVSSSNPIAYPLRQLDVSPPADGAVVLVLASEDKAKSLSERPLWIDGISWATETPSLETRELGEAIYAKMAAKEAYRMAKVKDPRKEIGFTELDDTFSYKELQHIEAVGLCKNGEAGRLIEQGAFDTDGELPVNSSGGSLGMGYTYVMSGLVRVAEAALILRGDGGHGAPKDVNKALVLSWAGIPTSSGGAAILSS